MFVRAFFKALGKLARKTLLLVVAASWASCSESSGRVGGPLSGTVVLVGSRCSGFVRRRGAFGRGPASCCQVSRLDSGLGSSTGGSSGSLYLVWSGGRGSVDRLVPANLRTTAGQTECRTGVGSGVTIRVTPSYQRVSRSCGASSYCSLGMRGETELRRRCRRSVGRTTVLLGLGNGSVGSLRCRCSTRDSSVPWG